MTSSCAFPTNILLVQSQQLTLEKDVKYVQSQQ